jgi:hypothetical protein
MPEGIMQPFILEVTLSLGGLPQLREVIDVLKSVVHNCLIVKEKMRHSAWFRDIVSGNNMQVEKLLINVMQQCAAEWDHIVKGTTHNNNIKIFVFQNKNEYVCA